MWEHARIVARSRRRALGIGGRLLAGLPFWKLLLRGRPASAQVATTTAPLLTTTAAFVTTAPFSTTVPFVTTAPFTTTAAFVTTAPFTTTVPFITTAPFTTTAVFVTTAPFSTTAPFTTTLFDTTSPFTTVLFTVPAGSGGDGGGTTDVPEPSSVVMLGSGLAAGAAWFWGRAIKDRVRALLETLVGDDAD